MKFFRLKRKKHRKSPRISQCPQRKGVIKRCRIVTPRKPNSAKRPVAKVILTSKLRVTAHLPGKENKLRPYSQVLVRGGGARDLPGVYYTCIRGALDFEGMDKKIRRRSIYGTPQSPERYPNQKPRRRYRNL